MPPLAGSTCGNAFAVERGRNAIICHASLPQFPHPGNDGLFVFCRLHKDRFPDAWLPAPASEVIDESRVPVGKMLLAEGDSMIYIYDFGDNWRHEVVLEKIVPSDAPTKPICLGRKRRCPPEDVGGPSGYQEFLAVIFEPGHEEFSHFRGWAGGKFHAEEFDLKAVNNILSRMRWPVRHRR